MASVCNDPGGRRRIQFVAPDGARKAIRLGKVSQRDAESICRHVEALLASNLANQPMPQQSAAWLSGVGGDLRGRLARVGLIAVASDESNECPGLAAFVEHYISRRVDTSPNTRRIWRQTARLLADRFGAEARLNSITRGGAADWRLALVAKGMADASVRKHCGFAKHFFAQAVERELIPTNPFQKLISAPVGNAERQRFISREDTAKVLDAAPDAEWRLIIALSRFGGLRCPSEHFALTWGDVDWDRQRVVVRSPKTGPRVVPLFPELRPFLETVFDAAEPGTEHVITRHRAGGDANLRTQLARIIRRAGLTPWPRITHNLRASRATELVAEYPSHVAAAWLGHTTLVATKHYWQVTDADFDRAVEPRQESGAKSGAAGARTTPQEAATNPPVQKENPSFAGACDSLPHSAQMLTEVHGNRTHRPHG